MLLTYRNSSEAIPIKYHLDENARLFSDGEKFFIDAHNGLFTPRYNQKWYTVTNAEDDIKRCENISFEELLAFIPYINKNINMEFIIESDTLPIPNMPGPVIEKQHSTFIYYRIFINEKKVFDKDTLHDGGIVTIREEITSWIARFIYDYFLVKNNEKKS